MGIIAFLATLVQILLMFVRNGMVVLLIGILPLAAAMSNTEMGMHWFKKASAWLIAFALYKPAAAIVYAVAFVLPGQQGINALMSGMMMLILAVLALPALLRFVVPAVGAVAGGGGTGGFAGGVAGSMVGMRMPTGAAPIANTGTQSYDMAAATGAGGGGRATGSATPAPQGPPGIDGDANGGGRRGGGGSSGINGGGGPPGAAGTGETVGDAGAGGGGRGTANGSSSTSGGGGQGGGAGVAGGAAGGVGYVAHQAGEAVERAVGEQSVDDGPSGADGRRG